MAAIYAPPPQAPAAPPQQQGDDLTQALIAFATTGADSEDVSEEQIEEIKNEVSKTPAGLAYFNYLSACKPPPPRVHCKFHDMIGGTLVLSSTQADIELLVISFGKKIQATFKWPFSSGTYNINGKVFYNHKDGTDFPAGPVAVTMHKNMKNNKLYVTAKNQAVIVWEFQTNNAFPALMPFEPIPSSLGSIVPYP